jgi:uncharacterized membrane protein YeaQ/YmgE (transglycosylase-associated protein family)
MFLGLLGWIVVGLVVGFIASKFVDLRGDDPKMGIGIAALGAVAAGALYSVVSSDSVEAWNTWSVICAAAGAVVGAVAWHAIRSRSISKAPYTRRSSY